MSTRVRRSNRRFPRGPAAAGAIAWLAFAGGAPLAGETEPLHMFVTSTTGSGDFGGGWAETTGLGLSGLVAADKICQVRAEAAGLASAGVPVYRAWASVTGTDAYCHVQGHGGTRANACGGMTADRGPWARADEVPFAHSLARLVQPGPLSPASRSESDGFVAGLLWSGTTVSGVASGSTCGAWGSTSGFGTVGSTTSWAFWTDAGILGCGATNLHLACFQQGDLLSYRLPFESGAIAFVTSETGPGKLGSWDDSASTDGLAGADTVCRNLASEANLPRSDAFLAWLSDSTTDAKDRFSITGPWQRVDGVRVAASLTALIDGDIDGSLSIDEHGVLVSDSASVWTGTLAAGTKFADRCADWTSPAPGDKAMTGLTDEDSYALSQKSAETTCDVPRRLYCFGDVDFLFWDNFENATALRWSKVCLESGVCI